MSYLFTDLSIDLETLGTDPGCAIRQIGLCSFNAEDPKTEFKTSNIFVDLDSCFRAGLGVSWGAIKFWMTASDEARAVFTDDRNHGYDLAAAINEVRWRWEKHHYLQGHPKDDPSFSLKRVWGHGSTFDIAILEAAADAARKVYPEVQRLPWDYKMHRDTRTLGDFAKEAERPEAEIAHVAGFDAEAQARWIVNMYAEMRDTQNFAEMYKDLE